MYFMGPVFGTQCIVLSVMRFSANVVIVSVVNNNLRLAYDNRYLLVCISHTGDCCNQ